MCPHVRPAWLSGGGVLGGPNLESILALTGTLDTEVGEVGGWGEFGGDGDLKETP